MNTFKERGEGEKKSELSLPEKRHDGPSCKLFKNLRCFVFSPIREKKIIFLEVGRDPPQPIAHMVLHL
jgi:hypothetical protein